MLVLPIVGAVSLVWKAVDPAGTPWSPTSGAVCLAIGVLLFGVQPYFGARLMMKAPNGGKLMTLTASEQGIELLGAHSDARIDWSMIQGVTETKRALLIKLNPAGFQVVPKGQLSKEEAEAFRNFLRLHVAGK